jgi:membrane protein implicated in regulation of membrane protease activity
LTASLASRSVELVIPAWLWLVAGLGLMGAELFVTPTGLYLLFFGASAAVVGLLAMTGVVTDLALQLAVFAALSAADLLLFRKALAARLHVAGGAPVGELVGETAVALGPVPASGVGSGELRGASWRIRNVGKFDVAQGQRCKVERVDGLELWVRGV